MRKEVPEIGWGDFQIIPNKEPSILIIRYDWRNNSLLFIHNFRFEAAGDLVLDRIKGRG